MDLGCIRRYLIFGQDKPKANDLQQISKAHLIEAMKVSRMKLW